MLINNLLIRTPGVCASFKRYSTASFISKYLKQTSEEVFQNTELNGVKRGKVTKLIFEECKKMNMFQAINNALHLTLQNNDKSGENNFI